MTQTDPNKYLFDLHNFDKGMDFDPDNPPAPTYSQEQLDSARDSGFADGVKKGLADAQASRDQQILDLTRRITGDLKNLIAAEVSREKRFETELMTLVQALYKKTFPMLNDACGLPQITETIKKILSSLDDKSAITIEVAPQDFEELTDRLKSFLAQHEGDILIIPQGTIDSGSFRIKWKDGGAIRDTEKLAADLVSALSLTLAENPDLHQNTPNER